MFPTPIEKRTRGWQIGYQALMFGRCRALLLNVDHDDSSLLPRLHIPQCLDDVFQGITAIKDAPEPAPVSDQ